MHATHRRRLPAMLTGYQARCFRRTGQLRQILSAATVLAMPGMLQVPNSPTMSVRSEDADSTKVRQISWVPEG